MFFATILITSTASIVVYYFATSKSDGNLAVTIVSVLGIILFGAALCTLSDMYRRKIMVERPVRQILEATKQIASGNFDVKIEHIHEYDKYTEYDLIFDNINLVASELSKNEILKNDFISNVSHEIKTPLAVIQNYAKLLENKNISDKQKQDCLSGLQIQTKKLSELISNILKLNKLENQHIIAEIETFDLSELVRMCAINHENLIEKKNLSLECDIDDITITSSETMIEIVLNNLISNAIKFTESGGKIKISLKQDENHAILKVTDTGCGISNDVGMHIFEKFYQGDTSHSSEGNGLGLALVKRVIDNLGGEISVQSKLGKGSTFTIKLKKDVSWISLKNYGLELAQQQKLFGKKLTDHMVCGLLCFMFSLWLFLPSP